MHGKDQKVRNKDELPAGDNAHIASAYDICSCTYADKIKKGGTFGMKRLLNKRGMEMVQVAILVAIAVALGLIFKSQITTFVNSTFKALNTSRF